MTPMTSALALARHRLVIERRDGPRWAEALREGAAMKHRAVLCGSPSSVSDRRCDLPVGHPMWDATRFHRFRRPSDGFPRDRDSGLVPV